MIDSHSLSLAVSTSDSILYSSSAISRSRSQKASAAQGQGNNNAPRIIKDAIQRFDNDQQAPFAEFPRIAAEQNIVEWKKGPGQRLEAVSFFEDRALLFH